MAQKVGKIIQDSTSNELGNPCFTVATGGTITTSGDFKIHTFTGDGSFVVTNAGTPLGGTDKVSYMVVAGGGGGGGKCKNNKFRWRWSRRF